MNWLKNKVVVGILGIVAVAIVLNNFGVFRMLRSPSSANEGLAGIEVGVGRTELPPPKAGNGMTGGGLVLTNLPIEAHVIQEQMERWVTVPRRDPFQHFIAQDGYPGAGAYLTLSAVWRQTGSRLAVINQKVLAEGDTIKDYRLERIEGERVWVHGPVGLEPLDLELILTEAAHQRKLTEWATKQLP